MIAGAAPNAADVRPASAARFPLFDALRGIPAILILIIHAAGFSRLIGEQTTVADFVNQLGGVVIVFFIVSGFLIYRPFAQARMRSQPVPRLRAYLWRRALRVLPAYWMALTLILIFIELPNPLDANRQPRDVSLLTYYGFLQIYRDYPLFDFLAFPQAWSVCVEVSYYLALPLLLVGLRLWPVRSRRGWFTSEVVVLGAILVGSLAFRAFVIPHPIGTFDGPLWMRSTLPAYVAALAAGMLLAVVSVNYESRTLPAWLAWVDRFPGISWIVAWGAYVLVSTSLGLSGFLPIVRPGQDVGQFSLYIVWGLFLVLPAVFGNQERGFVRRRILANPFLQWMGVISYGFYLYHFALLYELDKLGFVEFANSTPSATLTWTIAGFVLGVPLAAASWYLLERPILRLKWLVPYKKSDRGAGGRERALVAAGGGSVAASEDVPLSAAPGPRDPGG